MWVLQISLHIHTLLLGDRSEVKDSQAFLITPVCDSVLYYNGKNNMDVRFLLHFNNYNLIDFHCRQSESHILELPAC